jgi:FkbM family methyltransferase
MLQANLTMRFILSLSIFFFASAPHGVCADNEIAVLSDLHSAYPEWKPRGVVDVGANRGGWTRGLQQEYPGVTTFMVEASPKHTVLIEEVKKEFAPNVDYKITVLSEKDGDTIEFCYNTGGAGTGDSMFVENSVRYKDDKPVQRTTTKLDTLVGHMEHVDYLKIDVQAMGQN